LKTKDYISLKEASEISGYSPDYIGQLIRAGKLNGKQVFQQVVWVTTEKDLLTYMESKRTGVGRASPKSLREWLKQLFSKRYGAIEVPHLANRILTVATVVAVALFLLLFYIFSSSVEQRLNQNALHTVETTRTHE
jgi:hypothetical protein